MRKLLKTKKGFEMTFGMLFSIIAGAVILFLAIYASSKFIVPFGKYYDYTEAAKQISNYLNPVYSGAASAYLTHVDFKRETRIFLGCEETSKNSPYFGRETIAFSEESGIGGKWAEPGAEISRYNKYIFSDNLSQGKIYSLFTVPLYAGFKADDLIMAFMQKYCFVSPPEQIRSEIEDLGSSAINVTNNIAHCPANSYRVCFGENPKCNVSVIGLCTDSFCENPYDYGYITKNGQTMNYYGNLIYAAIFSSPEIYECNVKRLGKKIAELGKVYLNKISIVSKENCNSAIGDDLNRIITIAKNVKKSRDILDIYPISKQMDDLNNVADCKIY